MLSANDLPTLRNTVTLPQLNGNARSTTTGDDVQVPAVPRSFEDERAPRHNHEPLKREYDLLASDYDLMFSDWTALIEHDADMSSQIIERELGKPSAIRILVVACGIGTQALGLAQRGYQVTGVDLSPISIARARHEAVLRGIDLRLQIADMRDLAKIDEREFDVAIILGNSLCVLGSYDELLLALSEIRAKVRPDGLLIAGVRDYAPAMMERPLYFDPPMVQFDAGKLRVVEQVWLWLDETHYTAELRITRNGDEPLRHSVHCRAVLPGELTNALEGAGFINSRWLERLDKNTGSDVFESGFDQLIAIARAPS